MHLWQLRCELVLVNAGHAWMMLRVAGWGGCSQGCSGWWGFCEGRAEGAAVRAGNYIGEAGAASLAPSLVRMTQLTTLDLFRTLRASAAAAL